MKVSTDPDFLLGLILAQTIYKLRIYGNIQTIYVCAHVPVLYDDNRKISEHCQKSNKYCLN